VERKRLHGLEAGARAGAAPGQGIYGAADARATYDRLAQAARVALDAGYPVIVDAAFLRRAERDRFRALARELGAAFRLVACVAPAGVLRARVAARARAASDASDAGPAVLEAQMRDAEAPAPDERALVLDTSLAGVEDTIEDMAARVSVPTG
jgi:predicted kinase